MLLAYLHDDGKIRVIDSNKTPVVALLLPVERDAVARVPKNIPAGELSAHFWRSQAHAKNSIKDAEVMKKLFQRLQNTGSIIQYVGTGLGPANENKADVVVPPNG